jgi:hypothetical protein
MSNSATLHENLPIIEVAEKYILDTLIADPTTGQYILNRLSDTVAVIWPQHVEVFLTRLRKQNHLPRVLRNQELK